MTWSKLVKALQSLPELCAAGWPGFCLEERDGGGIAE